MLNSRYFEMHELCPKGEPDDPDVLKNLQDLATRLLDPIREGIRSPIIVTSCYRSAAHNAAVGGAKDSYHVRGMAADITCGYLRWTPVEIAKVALKVPALGGLGLYKPHNKIGSFLHVDTRPRKAGKVTTWYYNGKSYGPLPDDIMSEFRALKLPV